MMEATNNNVAATGEEGLDQLLDSCLDDFNKPLPKPAPNNPVASSSTSKSEAKPADDVDIKLTESLNWGEEFKQFQNVMENFLENESEVDELKNLMSNFNENSMNDLDPTSFLDAIKDLTEGAQNIPEMSPNMLDDLFKNMDLNDPSQGNPEELPEIMPLMHNIMQRLMSKELLYPSLKDIVEKYPNWLDTNKSALKSQDYERYDQQFKLMKSVCEEFEKECDETEDAKKVRFEKVLTLMQKIQNYGNPPKELIADLEHSAPLDEHGNLQIPGMPQQCSIM